MMKLKEIKLQNFRSIKNINIDLHPQLTVIVGINGAGKTTILDCCAILLSSVISYIKYSAIKYSKINSAIEIDELDITNQASFTKIVATTQDNISWEISKTKKGYLKLHESNFKLLKDYSNKIQENITSSNGKCSIPTFIYYGTNRAVLDIPKKIKTKHQFDLLNTYDNSLLGNADFRLFFEWFREQEDYENELNREIKQDVQHIIEEIDTLNKNMLLAHKMLKLAKKMSLDLQDNIHIKQINQLEDKLPDLQKNLNYLNDAIPDLSNLAQTRNELSKSIDNKQLTAIRKAIIKFLPNINNIKIRRNNLAMVVQKNNIEIEIDQLSDGEKCLLALVGDLTRRLVMANPNLDNPLEGYGIILIDEIELHLHPTWQRNIVPNLLKVFPNCQFIITTHSPQVIGEISPESLRLLKWNDTNKQPEIEANVTRSIGLSTSEVLEEIMNSPARNEEFDNKIKDIFQFVNSNDFEQANSLLRDLEEEYGNLPEIIRTRSYLTVFE